MQLAEEIRRRVRDRQDRDAREYAALLREIESQVRRADDASRAALLAEGAKLSPTMLSDLAELAALDRSLRVSHLTRRQRHALQLHDAILGVSSVLEDVACFSPWRSMVNIAADGGGGQHSLQEEFKESMRRFHEPTQQPVANLEQGATKIATHDVPPPTSATEVASLSAARSTSAPPQDLFFPDVQRLASEPDIAPLPTPQWHLRSDLQLELESQSATMLNRTAMLGRPTPALLRDPHSLYGFHAQHATPTVVYRAHPSNGALQLDDSNVLDPLYVKRATLSMAIESTAALLRVQQLVHAQV